MQGMCIDTNIVASIAAAAANAHVYQLFQLVSLDIFTAIPSPALATNPTLYSLFTHSEGFSVIVSFVFFDRQ